MLKKMLPVAIAILLIVPIGIAQKDIPSGYEGVSWTKVVPLKKACLVKFDENSLIDDFAYMAAIPASTFYDTETDRIYSYPVLFYNDYIKGNETTLSLNDRQGLDYFMEDWISYNKGLNEIEYINVDGKPWKASNYTYIKSNDIYDIASKIALHDWSYSNNAVVAVVGDVKYGSYDKQNYSVGGKLNAKAIKHITLKGIKQDSLAPQYDDFYVDEDYKFIIADLWWPSISWLPNFIYLATLGMLTGGVTLPSADPDLQLYCNYDGKLMEVAASETWNIMHGPHEHVETYVYNPGQWKAAITDIPTKGLFGERHGTIMQILADKLMRKVTYYIDLNLYPGEEIELKEMPPFMARNADFELTWQGNAKLGLIVIDEDGSAVGMATKTNVSKQKLHLDQLGQGKYRVAIVQLTPANGTISYKLTYSWESKLKKEQANYIMNAAEGAIIASLKNAPLLYTKPDKLSKEIKNVVKKLGIKNVYVVDLNGDSSAIDELSGICNI